VSLRRPPKLRRPSGDGRKPRRGADARLQLAYDTSKEAMAGDEPPRPSPHGAGVHQPTLPGGAVAGMPLPGISTLASFGLALVISDFDWVTC